MFELWIGCEDGAQCSQIDPSALFLDSAECVSLYSFPSGFRCSTDPDFCCRRSCNQCGTCCPSDVLHERDLTSIISQHPCRSRLACPDPHRSAPHSPSVQAETVTKARFASKTTSTAHFTSAPQPAHSSSATRDPCAWRTRSNAVRSRAGCVDRSPAVSRFRRRPA